MPKPNPDETRVEFVSRCVPIVLEDGTAENGEQAVAICHSLFTQEQHKVIVKLDCDGNPIEVVEYGT